MARTSGRLLALLVLVIGASVAVPAIMVSGHAAYDHSTPNAEEVVRTAPEQVDVYFKEEVVKQAGSYFVRLFAGEDTQVSDGDGTVDDNDRTHITAAVTSTLPDGLYIVRWKTTSDEDGDEAEGAFCFYVNVEPSPEQLTECAALEATETPETPAGTSAAGTETPSAPTAEASPTVAPTTDTGGDNGSNKGAVIGGIIGGIVAVVVVGGGVALYMRRSRA